MNLKLFIKNPSRLIVARQLRGLTRFLSDKFFLKCMYKAEFNRRLDLQKPCGFNEKLQWLKLRDREPQYIEMVDKYEAKRFVADKIGEEYIIKTLGLWQDFDSIDFNQLPEQFVIKCTHDSAGLVICRDKKTFDIDAARQKIHRCLKQNYYYAGREWPYKNIKPRVLAEAYMEDHTLGELRDYKFFTFMGEPRVMHLVSNRQNQNEETYGDFFDMDFKHLDLTMGHNNAPIPPKKPENFEKMKAFARVLAKGTRHLRVDFYEVDGHLYFGELTFYQDSGLADIQPPEWNNTLGSWIQL